MRKGLLSNYLHPTCSLARSCACQSTTNFGMQNNLARAPQDATTSRSSPNRETLGGHMWKHGRARDVRAPDLHDWESKG
jgi:hypothetical protein